MDNSMYVGLSRQVVLQRAMDTVANNVANVNTPGFRGQNPIFKEYISDPNTADQKLSMVYDYGQYNTTSPGTVQSTGGTYDVALDGPGFLGVQTASGETQYTRAGNMAVNASGQLVTSSGLQIAGNGGGAITIPEGTQQIVITESGDVLADGTALGQLMVTEFTNIQDLEPQGSGLYKALNPGLPATETRVKQGALEGSNVNSVSEMSRMIEIMREYQQTMNMLKEEHDRETGAIERLSRVSG